MCNRRCSSSSRAGACRQLLRHISRTARAHAEDNRKTGQDWRPDIAGQGAACRNRGKVLCLVAVHSTSSQDGCLRGFDTCQQQSDRYMSPEGIAKQSMHSAVATSFHGICLACIYAMARCRSALWHHALCILKENWLFGSSFLCM